MTKDLLRDALEYICKDGAKLHKDKLQDKPLCAETSAMVYCLRDRLVAVRNLDMTLPAGRLPLSKLADEVRRKVLGSDTPNFRVGFSSELNNPPMIIIGTDITESDFTDLVLSTEQMQAILELKGGATVH